MWVRPPTNPVVMYAISRLKKAKNARQWRVHFKRRGELHAKSFPDLKYGGAKKALVAAAAWRDRRMARARPLGLREFNAMRRSNTRAVSRVFIFSGAVASRWDTGRPGSSCAMGARSTAVLQCGGSENVRRSGLLSLRARSC